MKRFAFFLLAAAVPLFLHSAPAAAAVGLFLKIGDIKGESQDKDHKDWIDILSYSMGVTRSGSTSTGGGGGAGKASFQDFSFVKEVDASSPLLFQAVASGKHYPEAFLDVTESFTDAGRVVFLKYKLTDVMVTSFSQSASSGSGVPVDQFSLNFSKIEMDYRTFDKAGKAGPWVHGSWDLKHASPAPEPTTWALLLVGLAFVGWQVRRRLPVRAD